MKQKNDNKPYHHGDARAALLHAVEDIVREQGIEAVTIRAAAKAIGVSHAAAFRHFADKQSLLTAFAAIAASELAGFMEREAAGATDPETAFLLTGIGYLRFAMERPGAFQAVFRAALLNAEDADYRAAIIKLESLLLGGKARAADQGLPPSALLAWGATHGLATLAAEGALDDFPPSARSIEALADALALLRKIQIAP
jgi:AcrR family transcriptional regulator